MTQQNNNSDYVFYKIVVKETYFNTDKNISNVVFYKIIKKIDKNHIKDLNIYDYLIYNNMIQPQLCYHNSYYCELSEEKLHNNYNLNDFDIKILHIYEINSNNYECMCENDVLEHDYVTFF